MSEHKCRLNTVTKAREEILLLGRLAGYSGKDVSLAAHVVRNALSVSVSAKNASAETANAERLWDQYRKLPVNERNAFYQRNKTQMGGLK
jgi:hypothetical protein